MTEADQARQEARERAIHAAALALVAREWDVSIEQARRGFFNMSRQTRERYRQTARTAFEAAEGAMQEAGYEWRARDTRTK